MYRIEFAPPVERAFRDLTPQLRRRLAARIDRLAQEPRPRGAVKLAGAEDLWRIRIGDYRVIYQILDDRLLVLVLKIGHRRDVCRR